MGRRGRTVDFLRHVANRHNDNTEQLLWFAYVCIYVSDAQWPPCTAIGLSWLGRSTLGNSRPNGYNSYFPPELDPSWHLPFICRERRPPLPNTLTERSIGTEGVGKQTHTSHLSKPKIRILRNAVCIAFRETNGSSPSHHNGAPPQLAYVCTAIPASSSYVQVITNLRDRLCAILPIRRKSGTYTVRTCTRNRSRRCPPLRATTCHDVACCLLPARTRARR